MTYDPERTGATAPTDEAGAEPTTAFLPKLVVVVVNAEALADRRAAATQNLILANITSLFF